MAEPTDGFTRAELDKINGIIVARAAKWLAVALAILEAGLPDSGRAYCGTC